MKPRLGVNIDHVATLRQQRGESYPSIEQAACFALDGGGDQITIHLREDRRHIQDADVPVVRKVTREKGKLFNLEMGCSPEIVSIAIAACPDWVCLVPERRQELTTEGGLNLLSDEIFERVSAAVFRLREGLPSLKISLFLESNPAIMNKALVLKPDAVEIHTGEYARDFITSGSIERHLSSYRTSASLLKKQGIHVHAGHGLTLQSVVPLLKEGFFEEFNIGHAIVCDSVFTGLSNAVMVFRKVIDRWQGVRV